MDGSSEASGLRVFINYRREDTSGYAGRLYDALTTRLPEQNVFMDIDAIPPGTDFVDVVEDSLRETDVVIAIIGPRWLNIADRQGRRRLDKPEDFVRLELKHALERGIGVIPVLVQDAEMPSSEDLPEDLRALARRNALDLSDKRWRYDFDRLVGALERIARDLPTAPATEREAEPATEAALERESTLERQPASRLREGDEARRAAPDVEATGNRYLFQARFRLQKAGFECSEGIEFEGRHFPLVAVGSSPLWNFHARVAFSLFARVYSLKEFSAMCYRLFGEMLGISWVKDSLCLAVAVTGELDDAIAQELKTEKPPVHGYTFEFPVAIDERSGRAAFFEGWSMWGLAAYPSARKVVNRFLLPTLGLHFPPKSG